MVYVHNHSAEALESPSIMGGDSPSLNQNTISVVDINSFEKNREFTEEVMDGQGKQFLPMHSVS